MSMQEQYSQGKDVFSVHFNQEITQLEEATLAQLIGADESFLSETGVTRGSKSEVE